MYYKHQKININDRIGYLVVINKIRQVCTCKCDCDSIVTKTSYYLINMQNKGNKPSCGCKKHRYKTWDNNKHWTGYKEISGTYFTSIKNGAKTRNLEFNITIEDMWNQFIKQQRLCALTNILLKFCTSSYKISDTTASLDRIDPLKGYVLDNIQWVHKDVNLMKRNHTQEHFIGLCKKIYEYNKNK